MATVPTLPAAGTQAIRPATDFYRAVWRWHFYAGLLVLPFLLLLAVTGALYLFRDEIDRLIHADLMRVEARQAAVLSAERQVAAAVGAHPGSVFRYVPAPAPDLSTEVDIRTPGGERLAVFVNPYSGQVLGHMPYRGSAMWFVRKLHSLEMIGPVANGALEIAAGWTILLVVTGVYLWWPRGQKGGVLRVRGRTSQRVFWRDLHAVTGIMVGGFILFLAVTGMPWSILWGAKVNELANGHNFGYPAGVRVQVPMSDTRLAEQEQTAWSLEQARLPLSREAASTVEDERAAPIGLDQAVARFEALGLAPGYAINPPGSPQGVYTGSVYPDDLSRQRVVHLDQYSGEALIDMGYADYGPLGRGLEWGINVHMGQEFGIWNQIILVAACLAIVLLSVSATVMWWKRRPRGRLGVPPLPGDSRHLRGVLGLLMIGGIIFPLVGVSLLVMALLDGLGQRLFRRPAIAD